MPARRCVRGHFIPAAAPTDACTCVIARQSGRSRRRRVRWSLNPDLWGQGVDLWRRSIRTVPVTGSYL